MDLALDLLYVRELLEMLKLNVFQSFLHALLIVPPKA